MGKFKIQVRPHGDIKPLFRGCLVCSLPRLYWMLLGTFRQMSTYQPASHKRRGNRRIVCFRSCTAQLLPAVHTKCPPSISFLHRQPGSSGFRDHFSSGKLCHLIGKPTLVLHVRNEETLMSEERVSGLVDRMGRKSTSLNATIPNRARAVLFYDNPLLQEILSIISSNVDSHPPTASTPASSPHVAQRRHLLQAKRYLNQHASTLTSLRSVPVLPLISMHQRRSITIVRRQRNAWQS